MKDRIKTAMFILGLIALVVSAGCSAVTSPQTPTVQTQVLSPREALESVAEQVPPAELKPLAELKPRAAAEEKMPFESKLFSLSTRSAPLQDTLLGISKEAGLNLVLGRGVDPMAEVSVELKNIPLRKALDIILTSSGYFYDIEGNVLHIKALETKIFNFDYLLVTNSAESDIGGDVLGGGGGGGLGGGGSDLSGEFTVESELDEEDVDVWQLIEDALTPGEGGKEGGLLSEEGTAQINAMAGTIIVTDRREKIQLVERYLHELELSLNRQVVIEAKIIQVSLNQGHQFGIDWNYINKTLDGREGSITIGSGLGVKNDAVFGNTVNWIVNSGKNIEMQFFMDALSTFGTANVLSSPRLNVINNQTAMISVGRTIPWQQWDARSLTTTTGLSTTELVPTIVFSQTGVTLGVTPQISAEGETTLHIVPIVTDFVEWKQFSYREATWEVPIMDVRESDTIVKAPDGATVIIGGLIQEKSRDNTSKIPLLGDVPWMGKAFQNQRRSNEKVELIIMLKPTIITR